MAADITTITDAFFSLGKLLLVILVLVFLWNGRATIGTYVEREWLNRVEKVEAFGISFERRVSAENTIDKIAKERTDSDLPKINVEYARAAIVRANRSAAAIIGARILWVDGQPQNNDAEASILTDLGIDVRRATNTKEALSLLPGLEPDLIISNVVRSGDENVPLRNCPAHYFEKPSGVSGDLAQLNAATMAGTGKATGFGMLEAIAAAFPKFGDHLRPRTIFYSASNGGTVANQCARTVTNRADLLLQSVVSASEEVRWEKLVAPSPGR